MKHTVYRTVNLINGKFYLGVHSTHDPHDSYLGSGVAIQRAVKKYGAQSFRKEVLAVYDNEQDMLALEAHIVSSNLGSQCYNLVPGGGKPPVHRGDSNPMKRPEVKAKNDVSRRNRERVFTPDALAKMRAAKLGTKMSGERKARQQESMKKAVATLWADPAWQTRRLEHLAKARQVALQRASQPD